MDERAEAARAPADEVDDELGAVVAAARHVLDGDEAAFCPVAGSPGLGGRTAPAWARSVLDAAPAAWRAGPVRYAVPGPSGGDALAAPVSARGGELLGALLVVTGAPGRFDARSLPAASALAAHLALVLENAALRAGSALAARRTAEDERRLRLLASTTALLGTASSAREIARRVPGALREALGCTAASLVLLDAAPDAREGPPQPGEGGPAPRGASAPVSLALARRAPVRVTGDEVPLVRRLEVPVSGAVLAVPLLDRAGEAVGALTTTWASAGDCGPGVQELVVAVAGQVAQALERARLLDAERSARAELADSLSALTEVAHTLQRSLLPRRLPVLERVDVAVGYRPAVSGAQAGGDWYDVVDGGDGVVTAVIGDVQGHSTTAAGLMGQLRTAVNAYVTEGHDPATALARANDVLVAMDVELFATCCVLQLDQGTGEVLVASAGHPAPQVATAAGPRALPVAAGPPLGVVDDPGYTVTSHRLDAQARVVLHTDGVVESPARSWEDGVAALRAAVAPRPGEGPQPAADRALGAAAAGQLDDAAVVVLDYAGPSSPREEVSAVIEPAWSSVASSRALLRDVLAGWGVGAAVTADAELVVSELVTNAVQHTGEPAQLVVSRDAEAGVLRIAVVDASVRRPVAQHAGAGALDGRGMGIVDVLALAWGVLPADEGKVVWALLALV